MSVIAGALAQPALFYVHLVVSLEHLLGSTLAELLVEELDEGVSLLGRQWHIGISLS